jgi:L-asparaginase
VGRKTVDLLVLSTGGTIDKEYGSGHGVRDLHIGRGYAQTLIHKHTSGLVNVLGVIPFGKDSLDITKEDRRLLVDFCVSAKQKKIIITHGTDTMLKTAAAVLASGAAKNKAIVFTGALRPAVMKDTDADYQLGIAVAICLNKSSGVWIAMNGVHSFGHCYKDPLTGQFLPK